MKLVTICSNCSETVDVKPVEETRAYLADKLGEEFDFRCPECGVHQPKHVNEVRARPAMNTVYILCGVGLVGAALLWKTGFIAVLPFALPFLAYYYQLGRAKAFNQYRLPRNRS